MPSVSVVVPTYNNESYIVEAVQSVFRQTHTDYELIIVDDGSTDRTRELLEPFAGRLRYHFQANQGLAVARNVGLSLAQGEFVTYLDGDDVWEERNLEVKAAVLRKFPKLGGVFSEFSIFDQNGPQQARGTKHMFPFFERTGWSFDDVFSGKHTLEAAGKSVRVYEGNVFEKLFFGNFILPTSMVFNRELALATGQFRAHMRTQQDYEFWLRFSRQNPFAYVDEVLVRYRRHAQQLTNFRNIERIHVAVDEIISQYEQEFAQRNQRQVYNRRKAELLANLAKTYIRKGESKLGREKLSEAVSRCPKRASLYVLYAMTLVPHGIISRLFAKN